MVKREVGNDSNCNHETEGACFSPELEDCSSDRECVNEDIGDDNNTTTVENEAVLSVSENVQDASISKQTVFETATNHQSVSSSAYIDFSRASVPLEISALLHDESKTEVTKPQLVSDDSSIDVNQHQLEVFVEDSEDNSFAAKLSNYELVKLKTDTVAEVDMEEDDKTDESVSNQLCFSDSFSDDENELQTNSQEIIPVRKCVNKGADLSQYISSPRLIVKLTRLLEYQCVPCDKTIFAINQREIHQHSRTHIPRKHNNQLKSDKVVAKRKRIENFDCSYCEKINLTVTQIIAHCSKEHPGKEPFNCNICSNMFHKLKGFYKHQQSVHNKKVKKLETQSKSREDHPKKKSDKEDGNIGIFDCYYCEKKSLTSKQMIDHCSEEHSGKEPFKCKMCPKMFSNLTALRSHKYRHRQKDKSKEPDAKKECLCEECGKAFHTREAVRLHIKFVHTGHKLKKFPCDICSKLIRKTELESHKKRHLGIKSNFCDECGINFVTQRELKDHVDIVHKNMKRRHKYTQQRKKRSVLHPFSCELCPYVFKKESALTNHLQLHDPSRKYSCDECGLRYKFYTNVITHKNYKHKRN